MNRPKIEDLRFSSSSIDDFWSKPALRVAADGRIRISGLGDLAGFRFAAEDTLIHLSQQDFWKLGHDESGHFIERLVEDVDGPINEKS